MKTFYYSFILMLINFILLFAQETNYEFELRGNFGATFTSRSDYEGTQNLEWLADLQFLFNYRTNNFHFDSDVLVNYGQIVRTDEIPEKTQDLLIFTLMPSIRLIDTPSVRLFLQTKGETQLRKRYMGEKETNFFDPLFLTNTIFIGEKNNLITSTENQKFEITYGIGYSFQQVFKKNFILESEDLPNSDVEFINNPSAIFRCDFYKSFLDDISFSLRINSGLDFRSGFLKSIENSRFSAIIISSLDVYFISLQYIGNIVYDKEISKKRVLGQSLTIGFTFKL